MLWNQAVDVQPALLTFQHHNQRRDKIRPLVENHQLLKECYHKKNHEDEDAGAGADMDVYSLIINQMVSKRLVKGIGAMNLMETLEVDDKVLAVLSELATAASMKVYRVT
jgi:hypothetical protein